MTRTDVRAQGSHSEEQIGANVDMETNADNDALIDEDIDNAEAISTGGASTTPRRNEKEEDNYSDSNPIRARQGNLDGAAAGGDGRRTQAQGLPTMEDFMRI